MNLNERRATDNFQKREQIDQFLILRQGYQYHPENANK